MSNSTPNNDTPFISVYGNLSELHNDTTAGHEVVVVDGTVADWQTLVAGLSPDMPLLVLHPDANGLGEVEVLAAFLAQHGNLDAIHLVTEGRTGALLLGNEALWQGDLEAASPYLQQIGNALKPGGDLMLYGCSVAAGDSGRQFVDNLAAALGEGVNVAASTDKTGPTQLGGDWDLEYATGAIDTVLPFTLQGMQDISHCLGCSLSGNNITVDGAGTVVGTYGGAVYTYTGSGTTNDNNTSWADIQSFNNNVPACSSATGPTFTSATYDASTNQLVVTGTGMTTGDGIDETKLALTGQGGNTYTLTESGAITAASATTFTVTLNATDQLYVEGLLNKNGTQAADMATTFNLAGGANWDTSRTTAADSTGNTINVSNVQQPTITSATYDASTGVLTVTGTNLIKQPGANNDIDLTKISLAGQGGSAALTGGVEITDATTFSVTLSGATKTAVDAKLDKNGTSSSGSTTYNLAAAEDWNGPINWGAGTANNSLIADTTGNGITVSGYNAAPVFGTTPSAITFTDTAANDDFSSQAGMSGTMTATDAESDAITFGISGGTTGGSFQVGGTGPVYDVSKAGTYGTLYVVSTGTDAGKYLFVPTNSAINARASDNSENYTVTAADASHTGSPTTATLTVSVTAANDTPTLTAPTAIALTDTAAADTFSNQTGTLAGSDRDTGTTLSYGISGGTTGGSTVISGVTYDVSKAGTYGTLYVKSSTGDYVYVPGDSAINALAADATPAESFTVSVSDGSLSATQSLDINITAANDNPVNTVAPAVTGTYAVGQQLTAGNGTFTDAENNSLTYTYQWYTATDNSGTGATSISGATASTYTLTSAEAHKYMRVVVTATDNGTGSLTATGNSAWTLVTNTAPSLVSPGTVVTYADTIAADTFSNQTGTLSATDADGDAKTYGITGGTTGGSFQVGGTGPVYDVSKAGSYGTLYVKSSTGDYVYVPTASAINAVSANQSDSFTVTVSDGNSGSDSQTLTVAITGGNDAPTDIILSSNTISTYDANDATVGTLTRTDVDGGGPTYTLVSVNSETSGVTYNLFNILGTALQASTPSTTTTGDYTVRVNVNDGTSDYQKNFTVTVDNSLVVTTNSDAGADATIDTDYATDKADGGGLSLREALNYATAGATIKFSGISGTTITLGSDVSVPNNVTFDVDSLGAPGSLTIAGTGKLILAGSLTINNGTGDTLTINSTLGDNGTDTSSLTKTGAGTLVLGGTNVTYSSGTPTAASLNTITVSGGKLQVTGQSNLCSGGITLQNGSTFAVTGTGVNDLLNAFTLGTGGGTIEYGNTGLGDAVNLNGQISGSGKLTKTGSGILGLTVGYVTSGATSNSGWNGDLEVQAGKLALGDKSWNYGGGNLIFDSGTTLYGIGDYGSMTVANAVTVNGSVTIDMDATTNVLTRGQHAVVGDIQWRHGGSVRQQQF